VNDLFKTFNFPLSKACVPVLSLVDMNVKLTKTQRILIESSEDIACIMRQILLRENRVSRQREHLWTIGLTEDYKMQYVELIAFGIPAKTKIQPTEIYRLALQKDCRYLYICHNRKSADMAAQTDDKALTDRMIQVGKFVGIEVFDHIIINPKTEDFLSYRDIGLMEELSKSLAWVPKYQMIDKIKMIAKEEGVKKEKAAIVKAMKKKKLDVKLIAEVTGLTVEEIRKA
jgi:DNA repair protein RadC